MKDQFAKIFEYDDIGQVLVWYEYAEDRIHFILSYNRVQVDMKITPNKNLSDDEIEQWCLKVFEAADKEKTYAAVLPGFEQVKSFSD